MGFDISIGSFNPFSGKFESWNSTWTLFTSPGTWLTGHIQDWFAGLMAPDVPKASQLGQAYALDNKQNQARLGASKPVLYGRFRIYPNTCAQAWTEFIDNVQYVHILLDLTLGKCEVEKVMLGNTPLEHFAGIEWRVYQPGETVDLFHNNVYVNDEVNDLELVTIGTSMGPAKLTFSADDHTITAPTGIFDKVEVGDRIAIQGSQFNDGVVTVSAISSDKTELTVLGVLTDETPPRTPPLLSKITRSSDAEEYGPARFNYTAANKRITAVDPVTDLVDLSTLEPGDEITVDGSALNDQVYTVLSVDPGGAFIVVTDELVDELAMSPPDAETTITLVSQDVGPFYANKAGTNISAFSVDISHPKGLYSTNDKGKLRDAESVHRIEWRKEGDTEYTLADTVTCTARLNQPQRYTFTYNLPPTATGRIEVKVTRMNETATTSRRMDESHWTGLRGFVKAPASFPPDGPIAVTDAHYKYPDMTKLAIRAKVTGQIVSGMAQRFNVWAQRLLPVWDGEEWIEDQPTSSIAWAYADALRNPDYGLGIDDSEIDLDTLLELDAKWATRGDYFNFYIDDGPTVWEAVSKILRCGRAEPTYDGTVFSAIRDEPRPIRAALLSDQSILKGSCSLSISLPDDDTAKGVRVTYWDPVTGDQKKILCGEDINAIEAVLEGCTSRQQAWNEGWFQLNQIIYRRMTLKCSTEMAGFIPMRGEFVTVQAEFLSWGQSARVLEYSGNALRLDQRLDWSVGASFYALLRDEEGKPTDALACHRGDGDDWLVLDDPAPIPIFTLDDDCEPTHVTLGVAGCEPLDVIIKSRSADDELHASLEALVEDERVHEDPGPAPAE